MKLNYSPLENLAAFAIAFFGGVVSSACVAAYIAMVRKRNHG
ncbi:hypothetical protein [Variovorax ginsengisoli]|uniref:DUF3149 domain-containing protein n=1 Tax=Variovorax ginsengisoli TaxID=363844 RepID=A0ABT8SDF6_9BURK|nr:hypothetical protein [Variovorax ginsengisoli]MDN8617278.1 hypothetical protein [Variovorax ginsengisoli]MDO1536448.1 hypothetical protein [Variovorax ginsengisoli]